MSKQFWRDAIERAVKSAAQGASLGLAGLALIQDVDWRIVVGSAAYMGVVSLVTSVASGKVGEPDTASAVKINK